MANTNTKIECLLFELAEAVSVSRIVAGNEPPRPSKVVELKKSLSATATAKDGLILFAGLSPVSVKFAMFCPVVRVRRDYLKIIRAIIRSVAIDMMDDFSLTEWPAKCLVDYKPMLVYIASRVCERMRWLFDQNVAVARDCSASRPVVIPGSRANLISAWTTYFSTGPLIAQSTLRA